MTKNLKIFLITFLLSLPFWWGIDIFQNRLESFLYQREIATNPRIVAALAYQGELEQKLENMKPIRDRKNYQDLEMDAKAAFSLLVNEKGEERILFQQEIDKKLPIASLTKLMTARIVLENYDLSGEVRVSEEAVQQEENFGKLKVGAFIPVEQLLYPLLMESSNDAAFALAEDYPGMDINYFVQLMNQETENLNLTNTNFTNPSGLDPNYSTARDLVKLTEVLMIEEPLVWKILSTPRINLYGAELVNTNQLLNYPHDSWWKEKIIGGKTGYTEEALGCFLLVVEAPNDQGYLINVILGSGDRFGQMEKLLDWLGKAYQW
jgi:D-alanyl-D-alanine carboxypeptidase